MANSDKSQKDNKRGTEPTFNWRGVVLVVIAFALIGLAWFVRNNGYANVEEVPLNRFFELVDNKQIIKDDKNFPLNLVVQEGQPTQWLVGACKKQTAGAEQTVRFRTMMYLNYSSKLEEKLAAAGLQPGIRMES